MKESGGNDPIEKAIIYQCIHLIVATIGINASSGFGKCSSTKLCGDDLRDQSENHRTRRSRNKEALYIWAGQAW